MNVDLFRRVDRLVGVPLCFALSVLDRLRPRRPRGVATWPPRRILLLKLPEMGSVVLLHPLLERARQRWPECEIWLVTFEESRAVVALLGSIPAERVLTISTRGPGRFVASVVRVLAQVRALGFDAVIDLEFFARFSALFAYLTRAQSRVGFHRFHTEGLYRGALLTHPVAYNPYLHTAHAFLTLLEALAHDPSEAPLVKDRVANLALPMPRFVPRPEESRDLATRLDVLAGTRVADRPLYLLNPNASELIPIRRWPVERYVELAERLLADPRALLALIGSSDDRPAANAICARISSPRLLNLAGTTSVRELVTLFTLATALVSNDSGPAHFASLTDLPTVTLFGPETPQLYGPLGPHQTNLYAGFACSPCVTAHNHRHSACQRARCLEAISVEQVLAALDAMIAKRDATRTPSPRLRVVS